MTVQQIAKRAQAIRKANPSKKWTDCIKQASKELKKGTGRVKAVSGAKPKTVKRITLNPKMLDSSQSYYRYQNEEREIQSDMEGRLYIMVGGKAVYFKKPYPRLSGTKGSKRTRSSKPGRIRGTGSSKHTDTKSHNTSITVLSGINGKPAPMVLNGTGKLVKGAYYVQQNVKTGSLSYDAIFKYQGKNTQSSLYPLKFDIHFKNPKGGYRAPVAYILSMDEGLNLVRIKKPTYKELAIGHLKLLK